MATVFVYLITYYFQLRAENVNKIMNDLKINGQLSGHQISSAVKNSFENTTRFVLNSGVMINSGKNYISFLY
jgi:hypothetical protein